MENQSKETVLAEMHDLFLRALAVPRAMKNEKKKEKKEEGQACPQRAL